MLKQICQWKVFFNNIKIGRDKRNFWSGDKGIYVYVVLGLAECTMIILSVLSWIKKWPDAFLGLWTLADSKKL